MDVHVVGVLLGTFTSVLLKMDCEADWTARSWNLTVSYGDYAERVMAGDTALGQATSSLNGDEDRFQLRGEGFLVWDGAAFSHLPIHQWRKRAHGEHPRDFKVAVLRAVLGYGAISPTERTYRHLGGHRWAFTDGDAEDSGGAIALDRDGVLLDGLDSSQVPFPRRSR
jgi:hypothetical protein